MKKLIILLSLLVLNDTKNNIYCDIKGDSKLVTQDGIIITISL